MCLVLAAFVLMILDGAHSIREIQTQTAEISTETVSIMGVSRQTDAEACFVLGCGSISGVDYFACYKILDDGALSLMKLRADDTKIYQTLSSTEKPYAEIDTNGWGTIQSVRLYLPVDTIQSSYSF